MYQMVQNIISRSQIVTIRFDGISAIPYTLPLPAGDFKGYCRLAIKSCLYERGNKKYEIAFVSPQCGGSK